MFKGSIPALITPFNDGAVDKSAFEKFVNWQVEQGSHAVVPCGTTGESPTLTTQEHLFVTETCIKIVDGRIPVIAGCGSNSTAEAIEFVRHAENIGAAAALVVTPYYNKPTQEGMYQHFAAINDASNLPVIIYNIPGRSVIDMTVETMARCFKDIENIIGVKDATGNVARVPLQRVNVGEDFIQLSGEDQTAMAFNVHGGQGCISVTANIAPKLCSDFQNACLRGDYAAALEIQDKLTLLHDSMFLEPSPGPVKYAAQLLGLCSSEQRLPLVDIAQATKTLVEEGLKRAGLL
jgi:4-hydroxy-tetrahydrodipicolinate synthase